MSSGGGVSTLRRRFKLGPEWQPALPYCVLGADGELRACNPRMRTIFGYNAQPKLPLPAEDWSVRWPFFDTESSAVALLRRVLSHAGTGDAPPLSVEAGLRTYRLHIHVAGSERLVVAELLRKGDLLQDRDSRQALFRSLAHEIRTSVTALKGFAGMLEVAEAQKPLLGRIEDTLGRLEKVVERLGEFRAELEK